jgi:hypothetical protein
VNVNAGGHDHNLSHDHPHKLNEHHHNEQDPNFHHVAHKDDHQGHHQQHHQPDIVPLDRFRDELVNAHNEYRARHSAQKLTRNHDLDELAQKWADHLRHKRLFLLCDYHYRGEAVGENTLVKLYNGNRLNGKQVAEEWYLEGNDYPFGTDDPKTKLKKCGRFSQMLWASSKEIGVGRVEDKDGCCWIVCLYSPQGNVRDHFKNNVLH